MQQHSVLRIVCLSICLLSFSKPAASQLCLGSQWVKKYTGAETQSIVKSLVTSSGNILSAGNIQYLNSSIVHNDGWVALNTVSGNPIFSKRIAVPGFDILQINDLVATNDSSYLITGTIQTFWGVRDPAPPNPNWGVLISIDNYGNVLWIKKMDQGFDPTTESTFLQNIFKTKDGDFILNAVVWKKPPFSSKGLLFRIDKNGNLKWITTYSSPVFEFKYTFVNQIIQSADGKNIITAGIIDERFKNKDSIVRVNHYMLEVDYETGQKKWDQSLNIRTQFSNVFTNYQSIRHITELPNGDFSFLGFGDTSFLSIPPITTRSINIICSPAGTIKKMIDYYSPKNGTSFVDAIGLPNAGHQVILLNDDSKTILTEIDENGTIQWQKGFKDFNTNQQPTGLLVNSGSLYIPMNGFGNQKNNYIYKTDIFLNIDCMATTSELQSSDASVFLKQDDAQMNVINEISSFNLFSTTKTIQSSYPLATNDLCHIPCCAEVLDTLNTTTKTVCEKDNYQLPDGVPVTVTGTYFTTNKTVMGCDSISYYNITILKDPADLKISGDTCLEGRDSVVLVTLDGYDAYTWNSTIKTIENKLVVNKAGTYNVAVSNQCGSKSASINVLAICDAPIYIPNAFTPNKDRLNEVFRVPPTDFYQLNSFQIYNRWGELIYNTRNIKEGWDGTYKSIQQPSGIYTYLISITSLKTGKTIQRNGSVQLIR
jgi:gliding motility-associated-like protein